MFFYGGHIYSFSLSVNQEDSSFKFRWLEKANVSKLLKIILLRFVLTQWLESKQDNPFLWCKRFKDVAEGPYPCWKTARCSSHTVIKKSLVLSIYCQMLCPSTVSHAHAPIDGDYMGTIIVVLHPWFDGSIIDLRKRIFRYIIEKL